MRTPRSIRHTLIGLLALGGVVCFAHATSLLDVSENDVFVDRRGLIYLIDRDNGLDILRLGKGPKGG